MNALNSEWVQREIKHAQSLQKKIIPLMRPGIGPAILRLIFGEEPVGIPLGDGPAAVQDALPKVLAAVGLRLPTETINRIVAQSAPVADLVLELRSPAMGERGGVRRAAATATLTYSPVDGSPEVESQEYGFTAPLGPIEAEEIAWYLERYINWPAGLFEERAQRVVDGLPK